MKGILSITLIILFLVTVGNKEKFVGEEETKFYNLFFYEITIKTKTIILFGLLINFVFNL